MSTCTHYSFFAICFLSLVFFVPFSIVHAQPTLIDTCHLTAYDVSGHSFWLKDLPGDPTRQYIFEGGQGGLLEFFSDSTARLRGRVTNAQDSTRQWDADLWIMHRMTYTEWTALGRQIKNGGGASLVDQQDWLFFELDSSRAQLSGVPGTHFDGDTLKLTHRPANLNYGFQYGIGANDKNGNFGLSGWFFYRGSYCGIGDVNVNTACDSIIVPEFCSIAIDTFYAECLTDSTFEMVVEFSGIGDNFQITDDQGSPAMVGLSPGIHHYGVYPNSVDVGLTVEDTSFVNCIETTIPISKDCTPVNPCDLSVDTAYTNCLTDSTFEIVLDIQGSGIYEITNDQDSSIQSWVLPGLVTYGSYLNGTEVTVQVKDMNLFSCVRTVGPMTDSCSGSGGGGFQPSLVGGIHTPEMSSIILDVEEDGKADSEASTVYISDIFPHPIRPYSKIEITTQQSNQTLSYLLVDGANRILMKGTRKLIKGSQSLTPDFSNLPPGLYFMRLSVDGRTLSGQRILITE